MTNPTFKTPLPSKVSGPDTVGLGYWPHQVNAMRLDELEKSHNQLIDCLTELREVVGRKQDIGGHGGNQSVGPITPHYILKQPEKHLGDWSDVKIPTANEIESKLTLATLKEQLLGEMRGNKWNANAGLEMEREYVVSLEDVEAIINRIIK